MTPEHRSAVSWPVSSRYRPPPHESGELSGRHGQDRITASYELMAALLAGDELADLLTLVADRAAQMADGRTAFIALPEEQPSVLTVRIAVGADADQVEGLTFHTSQSLMGRCYTTRRVIASRVARRSATASLPLGPILILPLDTGEHTRGVLAIIGRPEGLPFGEYTRRQLVLFATSSATLIEMAEVHRSSLLLPLGERPPADQAGLRLHLAIPSEPR